VPREQSKVRAFAAVVLIGLLACRAQAGAPTIRVLLHSQGFEDPDDPSLALDEENSLAGITEVSTDQASEGGSSMRVWYDGVPVVDITGYWTDYSRGFDASLPHDGYVTAFQLYPVWGSQLWRNSTTSDGGNHIGLTVYSTGPDWQSGYADIVVGLMDSENDGQAALGVMYDYGWIAEGRQQRVADVPLGEWSEIVIYHKSFGQTEDPIELWVNGEFVGAYPDWDSDAWFRPWYCVGNTLGVSGSGEYYVDDVRFGLAATTAQPGDADEDGDVDDDLSLLLASWGQDTDWAHGEFDGAPPVNDDDLSLLLANWTGSGAVPEPATPGLVVLGGLTLLHRRCRNRKGR